LGYQLPSQNAAVFEKHTGEMQTYIKTKEMAFELLGEKAVKKNAVPWGFC
jgi:hypothetical protein